MAYSNMTENMGTVWFPGKKIAFPMGSVKIYEGSAVFANSGKAVFTPLATGAFLGVAAEEADNTGNLGKSICVYTSGCYEFKCSGIESSNIGQTAYLDTSATPNTVTLTKPATSGDLIVPLGKIVSLRGTDACMVRIDGYALKENVTAAV